MNTCNTCKWWNEENAYYQDRGVCGLSKTDNEFMEAQDDIRPYDPFLMTSKTFGCNQHKVKEEGD